MPEATTPKHPQLSQRGHLLPLDGVRGLAILMVICSHAFDANFETRHGVILFMGRMVYYGLFGVDLFFVLSGFLITGILFDSLQDDGYFRKFYARRALRIFPLYYGVLAICLLLTKPLHLHWGNMAWALPLYLQTLYPAVIVAFSPGPGIALFHFWSLAVEEQFYLVWPAILFLVRSKRGLILTTLIASGAALVLRLFMLLHGASGLTLHVTTIYRADSLLIGGTLAMLYRSRHWKTVTRWAPVVFLSLAAVVTAVAVRYDPDIQNHPMIFLLWPDGLRPTVLAIGFAGLLAWSLKPTSLVQRVFTAQWLRFLGKYSYGIYVIHVLVIAAVSLPFRHLLARVLHNNFLAVALAGILPLGLSIVAAYFSYNFYERPFLRLKHHFDYKRSSLNHGAPEDAVQPAD